MSGLFSLFQIAGARSFSDFMNGGARKQSKHKKRSLKKTLRERTRRKTRRIARKTNRKTMRRTTRRTNRKTMRRTTRRTNRKTMRRTTRRTNRKTMRRTNRKVATRNLTKRKHLGKKGKYYCSIGCKGHSKRGYFKGSEPSPKGLGYCAHCTPLNVTMKGKDGNLWQNEKYSKGKRWVKV